VKTGLDSQLLAALGINGNAGRGNAGRGDPDGRASVAGTPTDSASARRVATARAASAPAAPHGREAPMAGLESRVADRVGTASGGRPGPDTPRGSLLDIKV